MYRILTENKNIAVVKRALQDLGLDYTIYYGDGSWQSRSEQSIAIELDNVTREIAETAAIIIKAANRQEAVLLQEIYAESKFL